MAQHRRQRVSFTARKTVSVPRIVRFTTSRGERVSFRANRRISKPVRVTFYRRRRR